MKLALTKRQLQAVESIERDEKILDFHGLTRIAKSFFAQNKDFSFCEVCGPISTGPVGTTVQSRIAELRDAIHRISSHTQEKRYVFDQLPFEKAIKAVMKRRNLDCYDMGVHEQFYEVLFYEVENLHELIFLPTYQYSKGASLEHQTGLLLPDKIKILYLEDDWQERMDSHQSWYKFK